MFRRKTEIETKIENRNEKLWLSYLGVLLPFKIASFITSGLVQENLFAVGPFRLIDRFPFTYIEFKYCRNI